MDRAWGAFQHLNRSRGTGRGQAGRESCAGLAGRSASVLECFHEPQPLDVLIREAVSAIDAGDVASLQRLLDDHPRLVQDRLDLPGGWLCERAGEAPGGFFRRPFLLWFVAEDPVRNGRLPRNIAEVARRIISAARRRRVANLPEQIDYALRLVCWSWVARECGVQRELMEVLLDAGASVEGRDVYDWPAGGGGLKVPGTRHQAVERNSRITGIGAITGAFP